MKVLLVFALLTAASYAASDGLAFLLTGTQAFLTQCVLRERASPAEFVEIIEFNSISRKEGRCVVACVLEKFEIQKDTKLSLDASLKLIDVLKAQDTVMYNGLNQIFEKCIAEVGDAGDRCDAAGKFYDCARKIAKAIN